ncbi:hypothetical protein OF83DRAFT_1179690 [Amylostereum chailletii]|nr:hypothetical protein OF83DRAFT_1179690 [Amylostereum chailletii]
MPLPSSLSHIQPILDDIKVDPLYPGNPTLRDNVEWVKSASFNRLILKRAKPEDPAVAAELRCIYDIAWQGCYLQSDGNWTSKDGPNGEPWDRDITKVKLNATLVPCSERSEELAKLGRDSFKGYRSMEEMLTRDMVKGASVKTNCAGMNDLKIRHSLFRVRDNDAKAEDVYGSEFSMKTWPTQTTAARNAIDQVIQEEEYTIEPLPAWPYRDPTVALPADHPQLKPIYPENYMSGLRGACVEARVCLSCEYIAGKNKYNFYADVQALTVLDHPKPSTFGSLSGKRRGPPDLSGRHKVVVVDANGPVAMNAPVVSSSAPTPPTDKQNSAGAAGLSNGSDASGPVVSIESSDKGASTAATGCSSASTGPPSEEVGTSSGTRAKRSGRAA